MGYIRTYSVDPCPLCGQYISWNGLSQGAHIKMHVKEGYFEMTRWNPNNHKRTDKPFNKTEYQNSHPERAYTRDDWYPYYHGKAEARNRRDHVKEMVIRKLAETTNNDTE